MLRARWKQVLFGALFQYVHGMATQLAHRMHQPQEEPLGDIGFKYLPVSYIHSYLNIKANALVFQNVFIFSPSKSTHFCLLKSQNNSLTLPLYYQTTGTWIRKRMDE